MGLYKVFRRFDPNFARVAAPLNALLKKGCETKLLRAGTDQLRSFELFRNALTQAPIVNLPDPERPYSVDTDTYKYQIGAALFQVDDDGKRHPTGFWRTSLTPAERNYSASERECLAVTWGVQILRLCLKGKHFTVFTD